MTCRAVLGREEKQSSLCMRRGCGGSCIEEQTGEGRRQAAVRLCWQSCWGLTATLEFLILFGEVQRRRNKLSCLNFSAKKKKKNQMMEIPKIDYSLYDAKMLKHNNALQRYCVAAELQVTQTADNTAGG